MGLVILQGLFAQIEYVVLGGIYKKIVWFNFFNYLSLVWTKSNIGTKRHISGAHFNLYSFSVYSSISGLKESVFKFIVGQLWDHSLKLTFKVKYKENANLEFFLLSDSRPNGLISSSIDWWRATNVIIIINICNTKVYRSLPSLQIAW